jgi:hypothetical protein
MKASRVSKIVPMLFIGLLTGTARVQEVKHAPTVDQCRADQRLWLDKIEKPTKTVAEDFDTIDNWSSEMLDCESVDPENRRLYFHVAGEITAEKSPPLYTLP